MFPQVIFIAISLIYSSKMYFFSFQSKGLEQLSETSKMLISMAKENIPPNSQESCPLGMVYFLYAVVFRRG